MPELRAFTFDRQSAQRIVNAVGVVERMRTFDQDQANRLVRHDTDAQQHLRVTDALNSDGYYPAVVVVYEISTDAWIDLGAVLLKPRENDTFIVDDRVFCHPIAQFQGLPVFTPVGTGDGGSVFPAKLNSISGNDWDWTEQRPTGDGTWEDKPNGRTGTTATEFNLIPVTPGDVVPMIQIGADFRFAYWDLLVEGASAFSNISDLIFDTEDFTVDQPGANKARSRTAGFTGSNDIVTGVSGTFVTSASFNSSTCVLTVTTGSPTVTMGTSFRRGLRKT